MNIFGLIAGIAIVIYAVMNTGDSHLAYYDFMSVVIVVGGTLSVSIMTNGLLETAKLLLIFFKTLSTQKYNNIKIAQEVSEVARKHHFGSLNIAELGEDAYHPFMMDGLRLLHNKFDQQKLKSIMVNMIVQRSNNHEKIVDKIELIAKYPPAFGMAGTIIGLVAVLKQISTPDNMSSIGPSMAIALITTLYGIILSSYVFLPIADNLKVKSQKDIMVRQIIAEGIILISEGHDPIYIREVLVSFLTPKERKKFYAANKIVASEQDQEMAA